MKLSMAPAAIPLVKVSVDLARSTVTRGDGGGVAATRRKTQEQRIAALWETNPSSAGCRCRNGDELECDGYVCK